MMPPIVERVPARAALAGNPSDGHHGAVFALPVAAYSTIVSIAPRADGYELSDAHCGSIRFAGWADVQHAIDTVTAGVPHCLLLGAVATTVEQNGSLQPFRLSVETTIPMSVGLAGSSAIVIAALRALRRWSDGATAARDDDALAVDALAVETDRLGIAAGLQDRVVQVRNRPMLMRFDREATRNGPGRFTAVESPTLDQPFRFLVAVRAGSSAPSQTVHGDLRARFDAHDERVIGAMPLLAQHAVAAATAYVSGDVAGVGAAMDATFDVRASMLDLAPRHVEMIHAAQAGGAYANYTGSGGAIVVLCADDSIEATARHSLNRLGCDIVSVDVGSAPSGAR